jgi:MoaA/NifB/PqqE/SkfB family radical SAM enzyme
VVVQLRECGVETISVSVESPDRKIHDSLRGDGSHDAAVNGIHLLRSMAPEIRVGINCTITAKNFRNLDAMVPFAESLDVHQLKFAPVHTNLLHRKKDYDGFEDVFFTEGQIAQLNVEIARLGGALRRTTLITTSPWFLSKITSLARETPPFRCYAGFAACTVNPDGTVTPCSDMDGSLSVRTMSLDEIWRSREYHAMRSRVACCSCHCWDALYAEISLRFNLVSLVRNAGRTWREFSFYFGRGGR